MSELGGPTTPQFRSLLDFVLENRGRGIFLVHATCARVIDEWFGSAPIGLHDVVASAADHECPE